MFKKGVAHKKPSTCYAASVLIIVLAIVLGANYRFDAPIQPMFLIAWLFVYPACMSLGYTLKEIDDGVMESCKKGFGAVLIMMAVGAIISTWIAAGTVPAIIYYGLQIISPKVFLLTTFVLCSMVSLACGTSWGTMGTAGIAMYAVGASLGIPAPLTVGAIVSGSYLGDMVSPMSDSTNVVAAAVGMDLITHCKQLAYIAAPVSIITAALYYIIGLRFSVDTFDNSYIIEVSSAIAAQFNLGFAVFLPMIFLLILLMSNKPAMLSMVASALLGCFIAVLYQDLPSTSAIQVFWTGFKISTGNTFIDTLLNRGGVQSMFAPACLMFYAFGMIGAFNTVGILDAIVEPIVRRVRTVIQLTAASQFISIIGNMLGTNTFSLLMTGTLMSPVYAKHGLHPTNLSKAINATSTVFCPLIPWNASGIYVVALFGISTASFAPYAFYSYIMPIAAFLFVVFGLKVVPASVNLDRTDVGGAEIKTESE